MRIAEIRATTVSVPLEAPLRHANGCHWGRFVRTIVELETECGLVGLGEMGGGGEAATAAFQGLRRYLIGHDPARLEELRFLIANPTASLYNNRTQLLAALEFACLDVLGQRWGVPVSEILGGRLRERVPFASYLFFRYPNPKTGARRGAHGRAVGRLRARAEGAPRLHQPQAQGRRLRPRVRARAATARWRPRCPATASASTRTASGRPSRRSGSASRSRTSATTTSRTRCSVCNGMRRVREKVRMPLATNTVVVNFEQLAANVLDTAVDVVLLDTTFWGGIRPCVKAAGICETFQLGVAVHSSGELGIQLATMLHMGAVRAEPQLRRGCALPSPDG